MEDHCKVVDVGDILAIEAEEIEESEPHDVLILRDLCQPLEELAVDSLKQEQACNVELPILDLLQADYKADGLVPGWLEFERVVHASHPEMGVVLPEVCEDVLI